MVLLRFIGKICPSLFLVNSGVVAALLINLGGDITPATKLFNIWIFSFGIVLWITNEETTSYNSSLWIGQALFFLGFAFITCLGFWGGLTLLDKILTIILISSGIIASIAKVILAWRDS